MRQLILSLSIAFALAFSACEPLQDVPEDTTPPDIRKLQILPQASVEPGDTVWVEADVEDPSGISEIRLEMHDVFDGHGHIGKTSRYVRYAHTEIVDANSSEVMAIDVPFVIPQDAAAGPYALHAEALDIHANRSPMQVREFTILSPSLPRMKGVSINADSSEAPVIINRSAQERLSITALLQDDDGLSNVTLRLNPVDEMGRMGEPVLTHIQSLAGLTSFQLDLQLSLAEVNTQGEYALLLLAQDLNGLTRRYRRSVIITP